MLAASASVLVLLASGVVHSPLDFEVSLGSSIEDDDADLDDLLTVEDDASLEDAFADAFADAAASLPSRRSESLDSFERLEESWRSLGADASFFLQRDFAAAWEWIRADAAKQLQKAAPTAEIEFLFLGSGFEPYAELLVVHRTLRLARRNYGASRKWRAVFYDRDYAAFGDQWWRVSNVEGVPEPPSEENLADDEILYGDI